MHDCVRETLLGVLWLIICVYGFPLCVLFMGLAYIIMLMHDHPFLSFNGCVQMCVCVYVCVYVLSESNEGSEVGAAAPLSSGSPALRGNIPSYSFFWRPLERKWGRQLSDLPPSLHLHLSPNSP